MGAAEAEQVLRCFTRGGPRHPAYRAIEELGRAVRTAFICDYLAEAEVQREINDVQDTLSGRMAEAAHRRRPAGPVSAVLDPRAPLRPVRAGHGIATAHRTARRARSSQ
ncbi:Tn3 family transposase [Streptomyces sp. NPDC020755]|uniref:Tn3 family transposase n=1 Tax=unclassified Streptomyces TaxID=2593676 RepID=UPI00340CE64C